MANFPALLQLELRSLFGWNSFRHCRDEKQKRRYRMMALVWGLLVAIVFLYVGALVYGLWVLGLQDTVLPYLTVLATALILVLGLFTGAQRLFSTSGYDLLSSLPIRQQTVVASRFAVMYLQDLLVALLIFLPGILCCGFLVKPDFSFYLRSFIALCSVPAVPLILSLALGTGILSVSSRMRSKSLVQTGLRILLVLAVLAGSFQMTDAAPSAEMLAQLAQSLGTILGKLYPPVRWLESIPGSCLFGGLSLALSLGTVALLRLLWHPLTQRLQLSYARHRYRHGPLHQRSLTKALYLREAKRYFSSSIYVTNTVIGPILGAVLAVLLAAVGKEQTQAYLPLPLVDVAPLLVCAVSTMMTTTSVSLSMEGKEFWILRSLPLSTKALLDGKLLLQLSLLLPFQVVAVAALTVFTEAGVGEFLWILGITSLMNLFASVFGLWVNLKIHSFDWVREEAVVKQSLPAMLGGFAGPLVSLLLFAGTLLPFWNPWGKIASLGILALGTHLLYRRCQAVRLEDL